MTHSLNISGKDAVSFLNRQASNELKDLGKPVYAGFFSARAELVSLACIALFEEKISVICKNPEELKAHLEKFMITEEVEISLVDSFAPAALAMTDVQLDDFQPGESFIKLVEAHPEKNFLEKYVSFTKGCFPGQEPLAKFKNIGMKKRETRAQESLDEALQIFAYAKSPQELDPAIELLRKALKEDPRNEDAYESLGVMLAKQNKFEEAIKIMHALEMINPENPMAQMNLSIFYMKTGDKERAEEHKAKGTVLQFDKALKD